MPKTDALPSKRPSDKETKADWLAIRLDQLPGKVVVSNGEKYKTLQESRVTGSKVGRVPILFEPDGYKQVLQMAETFNNSGRVMRIFIDDPFDDSPKVNGIGFKWSTDNEEALYGTRKFLIAPDGGLFVMDGDESYPRWEPTDAVTFIKYLGEFVGDPSHARGELNGHARQVHYEVVPKNTPVNIRRSRK